VESWASWGPHIATEADARQLVRACYFGPLGERSFGGNRGTDYNAGIPDKAAYYREANEQMLVCALLEDVAVLENLDAILTVPGIDLYSIGPNDFAQSLGYPRPAGPSGSREGAAGDHEAHPPGGTQDASGRDEVGRGQRCCLRVDGVFSKRNLNLGPSVRFVIRFVARPLRSREPGVAGISRPQPGRSGLAHIVVT
jgi:HpcH/HpaI aldolase/citrate lyase family